MQRPVALGALLALAGCADPAVHNPFLDDPSGGSAAEPPAAGALRFESAPALVIPDNDAAGVASTIEVPDAAIVQRLSGRRTCGSCNRIWHLEFDPPPSAEKCECGAALVHRTDDKEDTIRNRLKVYHDQTSPLVAYYEKKGVLGRVAGDGTPEEVRGRIAKVVGLA